MAGQLDRPGIWPSADASIELADAIDIILGVFESKWKYREHDPGVIDAMGERLGPWLEHVLLQRRDGSARTEENCLQELCELAELMRGHCPDAFLVQRLGGGERQSARPVPADAHRESHVPAPPSSVPASPPRSTGAAGPTRYDSPLAARSTRIGEAEINQEIGELLTAWANLEPCPDDVNLNLLRRAARKPDWGEVRRLSAALIQRDGGPLGADARLTLPALLYSVAAACQPPDENLATRGDLGRAACLAAIQFSQPEYQFYLDEDIVEQLPTRVITNLFKTQSLNPDSQQPPRSLRRLTTCSAGLPTIPLSRSSRNCFGRQASSPTQMAPLQRAVRVTRVGRAEKPSIQQRTGPQHLLHLLYNTRHFSALRQLAGAARPLDDQIIYCLDVFEKSESDPARLAGSSTRCGLSRELTIEKEHAAVVALV